MRLRLGNTHSFFQISQKNYISKKLNGRLVVPKTILASILLAPFVLAGCATKMTNFDNASKTYLSNDPKQYANADFNQKKLSERSCLMRAMYFESNRSSREGMISVGTVVMNRVNSSAYPKTICGVVGQKNQFAPGVLVKKMNEGSAIKLASEAADAVLRGERSKKSKNAMFFHTAGLKFPYKNMHYVEISGGNAFYEKRGRDGKLQVAVNDAPYNMAYANSQIHKVEEQPTINSATIQQEQSPIFALITKDERANNIVNVPVPQPSPRIKNVKLASRTQDDPFTDIILNYSTPSQHKLSEISAILDKQQKDVF